MSVVDLCGPLDVGDVRATISTWPIPADETRAALTAATRSAAFDGTALSGPHDAAVLAGNLTIAKAQRREHERLATAHWFDEIRATVGVPAPKLLDSGTVSTAGGPRWWLVLSLMPGIERTAPTARRQRQLGHWLRSWHEHAPARGLRLDSPGGLGAFLGTPRAVFPETYPAVAEALAQVCQGMAMMPIHGDVSVGHNTLFTGDELSAILDPGVVHVGPPMLDLAWALAIDLPHGADPVPLLDGYSHDSVDADALDALLPHLLLRRLVDTLITGHHDDARWLANELKRRAPRLLELSGAPARIR